MPFEQSKAAKRRFSDGAFHTRYFVGRGIDIGGAPDPLAQYVGVFARMIEVRTWDIKDGDAQYLHALDDASFDFLHASHCLEHMEDVRVALTNWTRVVRPGGFLVITVPDEDLYEQGIWPSRYNRDHRWTFTLAKRQSWSPRSINVLELALEFSDKLKPERFVLQGDFFRPALAAKRVDQTATPVAECAIELIWQRISQ